MEQVLAIAIASVPDTRTMPTLPCCGTTAVAIAAIVPLVTNVSDILHAEITKNQPYSQVYWLA
jgi:hypothetical protein